LASASIDCCLCSVDHTIGLLLLQLLVAASYYAFPTIPFDLVEARSLAVWAFGYVVLKRRVQESVNSRISFT